MQSNDEDRHTLMVADHGINPDPLPAQSGGFADAGGSAAKHRRPAQSEQSGGWRDFLIWCGVPVIVILLVRVLLIGCYVIPTGSMKSTIEPGDRVVTTKLTPKIFDLQRGDIIVFHDPANWLSAESSSGLGGDYLIKRLIGLPGDVVECDGAGQPIKVNGVAIDESAYLNDGVAPSSFPFRVEVTEGHLFVMGDNRDRSADSRYHPDDGAHGLVPVSDVVGVAFARYWPLSRVAPLSGHHEVFAAVPDADR